MTLRPAVFLDRDGVLNERPAEHEYVLAADGFRWLPGAREAVATLARAGYVPLVVSNQRGIARGAVSWEAIREIEDRITNGLAPHGVRIAGFYYCPHELAEGCGCRKPEPGLLLRAAEEHGIDLNASVMIGDSESDVQAGRAAGCRTIRVGVLEKPSAADVVAADVGAAAAVVALAGT